MSEKNQSKKEFTPEKERGEGGGITSEGQPLESIILDALNISEHLDKYHLRGQKIPYKRSQNPFIAMLRNEGVTRSTCLGLLHVDRNRYGDFLRFPAKYLTLHDLCYISVLTGVSVPRMIQLIASGLTFYDDQYKRDEKAVKNLTDLETLAASRRGERD